MAVKDSTYILDDVLDSQDSPDFTSDDYYLRYNQLKVNADWEFRPNRKLIDVEDFRGSEHYFPEEVVIQSVRGETGTEISDDWYRIVFKDCFRTNHVGDRYRFNLEPNSTQNDLEKNIWLGFNCKNLDFTSSIVVRRCNGTIGSIYTDEKGYTHYHYEPVVQSTHSSDFSLYYNRYNVNPQGSLIIVAQNNKYTTQYKVNQRFVIGQDSIYKIDNILRIDSQSTNNPNDVGLIELHLSYDQVSKMDDMEHRMAYNGTVDTPHDIDFNSDAKLLMKKPESWDRKLTTAGTNLEFVVYPYENIDGLEYQLTASFADDVDFIDINDYVQINHIENGKFDVFKKKSMMNHNVVLTCKAYYNDEEILSLDIVCSLLPF